MHATSLKDTPRIMDSYIQVPQIHERGRESKMMGGPFIDYGGKRVDEIRVCAMPPRRRELTSLNLPRI
jgi:hypothetical protein